jgi:hypothetical protein
VKKIGFIDYFLDEWHANQYPGWIEQASGGEMKVAYAYGKTDAPGGTDNRSWCRTRGIEWLDSIEAVVERSDGLIVLAPDHPEFHEELSELPLRSGKPTYIDKTFAPDRRTALKLFELADRCGTPMYSSSALRYAAEVIETDRKGIAAVSSFGPGRYDNYSIHQIEPIVSLLGSEPRRVMFTGTAVSPALLIGFADGRQAEIHHYGRDCPFSMAIHYETGRSRLFQIKSDYFRGFIRDLTAFFDTGTSRVPAAETVAVITIIEYGALAARSPYRWVELPAGS